jgi:hypothetical protein
LLRRSSRARLCRRWLAKPGFKRSEPTVSLAPATAWCAAVCIVTLTVEVPTDAAPIAALPSPLPPGVIEVEFGTGVRLRICGAVETPIVSAVMQALADCGRR